MNKYNKVKTFNFGGNTDEHNELYLCIDEMNNVLYFCSDKDGDFNIYSYNYEDNDNDDWIAILSSDDIKTKATPITAINTSANEECPYVYGDYLFFISNRPGGFGGTDIYYSKRDDKGNFGTPINLGENVNTQYNEYRVSCYLFDKRTLGYTENPWQSDGFPDFVIFSSDRPGGDGFGFVIGGHVTAGFTYNYGITKYFALGHGVRFKVDIVNASNGYTDALVPRQSEYNSEIEYDYNDVKDRNWKVYGGFTFSIVDQFMFGSLKNKQLAAVIDLLYGRTVGGGLGIYYRGFVGKFIYSFDIPAFGTMPLHSFSLSFGYKLGTGKKK